MPFKTDLVLIDLASLAHPIFATSTTEMNPDYVSIALVAKVRALVDGHQYVAICYDGGGRLFRKDLDPAYKATRPERNEPLQHQIGIARQALANEGYPVWGIGGFEADDVIASAVTQVKAKHPDMTIMIVSADKDLYQLIGPTVFCYKDSSREIFDEAKVVEKFEVTPAQMLDYLCLVGDSSDNVRGVTGIGAKKAPFFLKKWGSVEAMLAEFAVRPGSIATTEKGLAAFQDFAARADTVRKLITLRTDLDLPLTEWFEERRDRVSEEFEPAVDGEQPTMLGEAAEPEDDEETEVVDDEPPVIGAGVMSTPLPPAPPRTDVDVTSAPRSTPKVVSQPKKPAAAPMSTAMVVQTPEVLPMAPAEREWHLQPRSMPQAQALAMDLHKSGMLASYGSPHAVLSTIILGQELGIPAMTALRTIHVINGRHSLSAQLIVAKVLQSGLAEYFEPIEVSATKVVYETKRKNGRSPIRLEHTIEMAQAAELIKPGSNWVKVPTDMLVARCSVRLARLVYPDIVANVYTPDELQESGQ